MKKILVIIGCAMGWITGNAQDSDSAAKWRTAIFGDYRLSLGVQIGTDMGGAVPYPLHNVPKPVNAYPHVNVSLGAKCGFPLYKRFSLGLECTYKTVAMDADARVENQKFDDGGIVQYFSGTAEMHMSFTMIEVPLYVKYRFNNSNKVLFGGYYAHVLSPKFETIARQGYIGASPDFVGSPVTPEAPQVMNFSSSLGRWDAGMMVGYELQVFSRLHAGLRFLVGFKDIFKRGNRYFDYKMIPMRGAIVVSYNVFNVKLKKQ
ncbi:MAG: PorT family protein [Prevotellaceae bacterium]|nr:PorT family protein [Prevotellaceae bacterium]